MRKWHAVLASLTTLAGAGCGDPTTPAQSVTDASLSAALSTVPAGYGDLATSFVGGAAASAGDGAIWLGGGRDARMGRGEMMGGGMGDDFLGAVGFGRGFGHQGPFGGGLSTLRRGPARGRQRGRARAQSTARRGRSSPAP